MADELDVSTTPATPIAPDGRALKVCPIVVKSEDGRVVVGRLKGTVDMPAKQSLKL